MGGSTTEFPILDEIGENIQFCVLRNRDELIAFCEKIPYLDQYNLIKICELYDYPLSIIRELQYTDKMYRDAYYIYLSHLHFDIKRHCERLAVFKGAFRFEEFFDNDNHKKLQEQFAGTMVIRPNYNNTTEHTLGRTLLNPYKMKIPFRYIRTARYKMTICGQRYTVEAFPFSNQHGDVLRCAETSIWSLMEYYGSNYENCRTILPSKILEWASKELPVRTMPSDGLTYQQISALLKTFDFEPRIYERNSYQVCIGSDITEGNKIEKCKGDIGEREKISGI